MNKLRALWRYCVLFVFRAPPIAPGRPIDPPPPPVATMRASEAPDTAAMVGDVVMSMMPQLNRHERRRLEKWERERRKHDVLVAPAIPPDMPPRKPPPPKADHAEPRPKPEPPPDVPDASVLIDGGNGLVYHERELYGEFTFRDTILEQLDLYWVYLRRMKQRDPEAYEFYKRIGATIVPPISNFLHDGISKDEDDEPDDRKLTLTPWWRENRPGFGCVTYGITKKVERDEVANSVGSKTLYVPKFFYFVKFDRPPPEIAPVSGGDVYELTIWWDRPFQPKYFKKGGVPTRYAVCLTRDSIEVLRLLDTKMVKIPRKKNGLLSFSVPQRAWRIPDYYTEWAKHLKESPEHLLARMFMDTARTFEYSNYGMIRVAVHNGDLTAQFVVDPRRMSYFFQDRDIVYTPNGARESCFHIVRAHERHTKHGDVPVKFHFRGANEFTWAGYRVTVTVPDRDHASLARCDVGVSDMYWISRKDRKLYVDGAKSAEIILSKIEGRQ